MRKPWTRLALASACGLALATLPTVAAANPQEGAAPQDEAAPITLDLYNLTDAEQELLQSKRRGHALFIIGSKRLHVNFEIPAYKFSYMGKAGGR